MTDPFVREGDRVRVRLDPAVRELLAALPGLLDEAGDGGRLDYRTHPNDAEAEARYRDLVGDTLGEMRSADRAVLAATASEAEISVDDATAWMRVLGEGRLVLAERVGISEDGWEYGDDTRPEMAVLRYLGYLQDHLVDVL